MKKIEVKVRYLFEGTYTVAADDRNEARTMVTRDCGLVLGGNIHTTLDDDEVDWEFNVHPDIQILSYTEKENETKRLKMDFSDRIETLRKDIIDAIRHHISHIASRYSLLRVQRVWSKSLHHCKSCRGQSQSYCYPLP